MPFKNENFSDLKLSKVRDYAQGWVKDYPCIEKIALYEIGFEFHPPLKYTIVVTAPKYQYSSFENDEGLRCFSLKYKKIHIGGYKKDYNDPEFGDLVAYYKWVGIDGCDHISACIPLFYKKEDRLLDWQRAKLVEEWYWWKVEPGEDAEDLNSEANEFVQELTKLILYPLVAGCLEDGSQNTIGQSKTSDNKIYDEKLEQTPKYNDPQAGPFKSNHEDVNRDTPVQNIDHSRSFVLKGDRWDITFDGETIILNNIKPIRYLLEALKNPKKDIPYSTIVDIVSGSNQTHDTEKDYSKMCMEQLGKEGFIEKSNAEMDSLYTEEDVKEIFKNLEEQYLKLKDGTQKEKDWINEGIRFFEREYWYRVIKTKDSIRLGQKSNVSKRAKDDSSLIRNSIKGVMKRLKGKSLHRHLELYLHIKNGVKYDPPEDQPLWEIKDT